MYIKKIKIKTWNGQRKEQTKKPEGTPEGENCHKNSLLHDPPLKETKRNGQSLLDDPSIQETRNKRSKKRPDREIR